MTEGAASTRIVIVGAGMAALRLVEGLVERGVPAHTPVTLLGDEGVGPYNRILLSAVLEGTHRPASLALRPAGWYADHGIDLRLGHRVVDLHRDRAVVELDDRTVLSYGTLVLATGSRPTLPPIRGLVQRDGQLHPSVHAFRSVADCERLLAAVPQARRAVVVGGGLLGIQVARALSLRGLSTEVIEGGDHLLPRHVDAAAGAVLARSLTKLGTSIYTGTRAIRLTEPTDGTSDGSAAGLQLDNGFVLDADLIILCAGGRPAANLARRADLDTRRGVLVDATLRTSDENISAIGDCAEPSDRGPLPLAGLVPPAWEQADVLAARLAGGSDTYAGVRTVARLRATDVQVAILGDPEHEDGTPGTSTAQLTNQLRGTHRKLVVREGRIVAGTLVGDLGRLGVIGKAFEHGTVLGPREPEALLLPESRTTTATPELPDDAQVCACAGVSAGRIRACASIEQVRETTRATTGCGGCTSLVTQLLQPHLVKGIA